MFYFINTEDIKQSYIYINYICILNTTLFRNNKIIHFKILKVFNYYSINKEKTGEIAALKYIIRLIVGFYIKFIFILKLNLPYIALLNKSPYIKLLYLVSTTVLRLIGADIISIYF
ncbi:hypothetical protein BO99DRAFT_411114 [Aspergillus violaceofuscus CBS 115571]|uniref:Uncharacterized protein n=1 Tax=Aspergillus violaceofuscus (strain CBS 115571) TaxID=1450538 RepID=A0A2V5HIF8_ASPV1|nr:hypothetical protein BO99DRAFT_411114 [Aspergillus violaceofuscus CBS 115571]